MNAKILITALVLLIGGIMSIATSAVGMQCYNSPVATIKTDKSTNYSFMTFNLVSAVLSVIVAGVSMYYGVTAGRTVQLR